MPTLAFVPRDDIDTLADQIADTAAHLDAATHTLLTQIRHFDDMSGWHRQGALTCAHWLSWRIGLDLGAAREKVRVARALGTLPHIDDALRLGQVSYSKARAMTRVATPDNEQALLSMARSCPGAQLEKICRLYRRVQSKSPTQARADEARRWVVSRTTDDGMVRLDSQLETRSAKLAMRNTLVTGQGVTRTATSSGAPSAPGRARSRAGFAPQPSPSRAASRRPTSNPAVLQVDPSAITTSSGGGISPRSTCWASSSPAERNPRQPLGIAPPGGMTNVSWVSARARRVRCQMNQGKSDQCGRSTISSDWVTLTRRFALAVAEYG
jgi:hypothetical protein